MSSEGVSEDQIREPRPRRLVIGGIAFAIVAAVIVVMGLRGRAKSEHELAERTVAQAIPTVEVILPQRGAAAGELVLPGDVQAFSTASIYARASGYVSAWYKDIGDRVRRGEKLADIDTPDLDQQYAQAKADTANAASNATLAVATAKRYHELVGQSIVSKQTDEERTADATAKQALLESAKANLARLESLVAFKSLAAPFDGIVIARTVDIGALINAGGNTGAALYQVADLHRVRIYVRVPQAFLGDLTAGTKATLRLPQYPGRTFDATLTGTSNAVAQESRTALVQLQADNPDGRLWPGTYAEVHFQLQPNPNALRVPATALLFGERGIRLATLDGDNKVVMKPVKIGRDIGADIEILAGLDANDRLIDSPLETLNAGDTVQVVKGPLAPPAQKVVAAGLRGETE